VVGPPVDRRFWCIDMPKSNAGQVQPRRQLGSADDERMRKTHPNRSRNKERFVMLRSGKL